MKNSRLFLVVALLLGFVIQARPAVLIERNAAEWRWRPGTNEASEPVGAWRSLGFSDTNFITAPAPLWYGDVLPGGTQISGMSNVYLSIFLRKTFVLTNTAEIATLRVDSLVDDGYVAWINGTEVLRVNMPAGQNPGMSVTITNLAANAAPEPVLTVSNLANPSAYLVVGTNVLAVQAIQSSLASSDFGFDASLESILIETVPPTVQSASPLAGSTVSALPGLTVTFSEPVTGVDAADLRLNGNPASTVVPVNSSTYSFSFAQPAYGTVQVTWDAGHAIADQAVPPNSFNATGPGATWQYTLVDQVPPAVATLSPAANETVRWLTNITVLFSENVAGVDAADLRINNNPATGLSGGGNVYTFSFSQPSTGLVQVAWSAGHAITDTATVPNAFAGGNWLLVLDPNAATGTGPVISEFMAANINGTGAKLDSDGESSDWIEIQNAGNTSVSLLDWSLTDDSGDLNKWRFPATNLPPGGFLLAFASEKDRRVPGAELHTNFKLESGGEYLALVRPNGTIASEFAPYAPQVAGVSYGLGVLSTNSTLVSTSAPARVRIPSNGTDGTNWLYPGFTDASWTQGTNGVGYGTTNVALADYSAAVLPTGPVGYWRLNEASGTTAANLGSGAGLNGIYTGSTTLGTAGPRPPSFNGFEPDNNSPTFTPAGSSFVSVPSPILNNRSIFTTAGWINPAAPQAARSGLFGQNDAVEFGFISASGIQLWTFVGAIDFPYPFPFGEWHHIAAVGTGSQLQLYLDGTLRASATMTGPIGTSGDNFRIGGGGIFDTTGNHFNGLIDEVAMWDRALNASELLALYNAGTTPAGVSVVSYIKTDVNTAMSNVNASAYVRLPFTIADPSNVQLLSLRARYDDGFVAYLNGIEVARANAPGVLAFNSTATGTHTAISTVQFQFGATMLRAGANVLAIHGLNTAANDEDFLITADLTATHIAAATSDAVYMTGPTPGTANGAGVSVLGPAITGTSHTPNVPTETENIIVTAQVTPTFASIGSVVVRYRVTFGAEFELAMLDDGLHGDGVAGDGIYGQTLPIASVSTNGQMIRWYVRATDSLGNASRWPLFTSAVEEEYLGTLVSPTYVTSQLPIFHLFIAPGQTAAVDSESGGRISVFHDGEFYDNIYMEVRGNTSAGLPKKAHRLEFNRNHEFRHPGPGGRVRKTSLLGEYRDSSRLRQHLSFWFMNQIGTPTPFHYPVRVQANGAFYQVAMHNDVLGQEQIERMGYDPKGAIYKAVGLAVPGYTSTGGFVKLEPDDVPSRADYDALAFGISDSRDFATRKAALFDLLDVPEVISYLVGARWSSENDDVWANMCLYRDTFGDQLWRCIPFDMDASWGCRWGGVATLEATVDTQKSHPLYGGRGIIPAEGGPGWNRIYDVIISVPEAREMYLRRMRTVMDKVVQPPGTPANQLIIENYIKSMTNLMAADMLLEAPPTWPNFSDWNPREPFVAALNNTIVNFVAPRRQHWYGTHSITNTALVTGTNATQKAGIPLSQPLFSSVTISNIEFNPSSGNQDQEYIQLRNPNSYAIDITGWKLGGAVQFTFKPGTVIPSNGVLYVSPNVVAFKARSLSPRGGEGNFSVGPYQGRLNARGETLFVHDTIGRLVVSNTFIGAPSLAQQYLRVTEIMYNPARLAGNTNDAQEFEYIELRNISGSVTLNLAGVRLTNGVEFNFTGSAVTSLAPGARVLVVKNAAAFAARYGALPNVAGQYSGSFNNAGEVIRLEDASGEKVLEFDYNNTWYPITDGFGFSLVIVNDAASWDTWGMKSSWRPSGSVSGAPGVTDPPPSVIAAIVINEVLSHTDLPLVDSIELWNPTAADVNIGGWFLTDDFTNAMKYRFPDPTTIPAGGYVVVDEGQFNANPGVPPSFALSSLGDEVFLFSADPATTNLTGHIQGFDFGAAETGVAFGRYVNSQTNEHFVAQKIRSASGTNAGPRVGPVAISEIMYHPSALAGGADNSGDEFVELVSITNAPTPLFNSTNTWRLRGGVSFDFPAGVTLGANASLIVAGFNPTNTALLASFRAKFNVPGGVPVYGPLNDKLDNSADTVRLLKPDAPTNSIIPYVLVEEVDYRDNAPWPAGADGSGASLQRRVTADYGNDPVNWVAATVTGDGQWDGGTLPVITSQPASTSAGIGQTAMFSVLASGSGLRYQWRYDGGPLPGETNSILLVNSVQLAQSGLYEVVVFNAAGSVLSSAANLTVFIPATILQQPANASIFVPPDTRANPTNRAVFTVVAESSSPLTYQWRKNGVDIPGATATSLIISNVQLADAGQYVAAITDNQGTIFSAPASLVALIAPVILQAPIPQTNAVGVPFHVSTIIMASPAPFTYFWRNNANVLLPGSPVVSSSTTNFFTINSLASGASANYRLIVSNAASIPPGTASFFFISSLADTDGDGMADTYETTHGGSATGFDPLADKDGDGMTNLAEFLAGTDPSNPASYLRVDQSTTPGTATVSFGAARAKTHTLQYTDQMPAVNWQKLADFVARTNAHTETFTDPNWTTNRFYRIATPRQP